MRTRGVSAVASTAPCCTSDGSAFYALAFWESRDDGRDFYREWNVSDEPGEVAIALEGDVGLVPLP